MICSQGISRHDLGDILGLIHSLNLPVSRSCSFSAKTVGTSTREVQHPCGRLDESNVISDVFLSKLQDKSD